MRDLQRDRLNNDIRNAQRKIDDIKYRKTRLSRDMDYEISKIKNEFKTKENRLNQEKGLIEKEIRLFKQKLEDMDKKAQQTQKKISVTEEKKRKRLSRMSKW